MTNIYPQRVCQNLIYLSAPVVNSAGGTAHITASQVALVNTDVQQQAGAALAPQAGTGHLVVNAQQVQLAGQQALNLQSTHINATTGVDLAGVVASGGSQAAGGLHTLGDVAFTAGVVAPGTLVVYTVGAPGATVSFAGTGQAPLQPLSAFGQLRVEAAHIEQGGHIWAPLGQIELVATGTTTLAAGSVTSVAADAGRVLPFGRVENGRIWTYTASGVRAEISDLPEKQVKVTGSQVHLAAGATVSVAGGGTGAWTLAQNAGQTVYGGSLGHLAVSWTPREENRGWQAVASSADGQRLAAVEYGGRIYTSTDAGETWTARDSDRLWYTIASSADGLHLVAGVPGGQLYTSADGGLNWTARESARSWYHVASSADGQTLLAAAGGEQLYTSTDGGVTWTARESNRLWFSVAMSADGERMVAAEYGGQVYTSTDRGQTWIPRETNRAWASLAASGDGLHLVALVFGGQIHTSGDGGVTWAARASVGNWISVAGAANGQTLVAAQAGGQLHASTDGGATWVPRATDHNWSHVCSSADGRQMLAVEHGGQIHKSTPFSTRGVTGGVRGGRYDALELQYLGDGVFMPLSHEGTLSVF